LRAGASDLVLLRGLQIDGVTKVGTGILHQMAGSSSSMCNSGIGCSVSAPELEDDIFDSSFSGMPLRSPMAPGTESNGSTTPVRAQVALPSAASVATTWRFK